MTAEGPFGIYFLRGPLSFDLNFDLTPSSCTKLDWLSLPLAMLSPLVG